MSSLLASLEDSLKTHQLLFQPLIVAYSGGRDSHVLLHALSQMRQQYPTLNINALHIQHGLHKDADSWAAHAQKICQSLHIPYQCIPLNLQIPAGESLENIARVYRYRAFAQVLQSQQVLLTAHSQDDQAETFLLQLFRGSGTKGLAGIAPIKPLGQGILLRPLLGVDRQAIAEYASQHQLENIEDDSNNNRRFRRNYLRHEVFPLLKQAYPGVVACIARSSQHCANTEQILQEYLQDDFQQLVGDQLNILKIAPLKALSPLKQLMLFRHWLSVNGVKNPSTVKCEEILQQMLSAKSDARPRVVWGDVEVRRYQGQIYLLPTTSEKAELGLIWDLTDHLKLPDGSCWQASLVKGQGIAQRKVHDGLRIGYRKGGERFKLPGRKGTRTLKKTLQELGVAEWERGSLPLFYHQQELVGVADLFVCDKWQIDDPAEEGWVIKKIPSV